MNKKMNPAVVLGLFIAALGVATPNPVLTLADGLVFAFLWWAALGDPVKTVMACMLSAQWAQASAKLWLGDVLGISLQEPYSQAITASNRFEVTDHTAQATALALAAIAALSLGARVLAPKVRLTSEDFLRFDPLRLAFFYFPLLLISLAAGPYFGGSLAQLVGAFGALRFAPLVLLIGVWHYGGRGAGLVLALVFMTEVAVGVLGFFSGWKSIFILVGVALVSLAGSSLRRSLVPLAAIFSCLILFGTVWTIIKPSYRQALNAGTGQQVVLLSPEQQGAALSHEVTRVGVGDLSEGFVDLLMRISYVDYTADVLDNVPSHEQYQEGRLWGEAIGQVLAPRFLFPNKPSLPSDSERTMQYTGRYMASGEQGTSISIGYVGESYIDFGVIGALAVSFLLGLVYSAGARLLVSFGRAGGRDSAIAFALVISFLWPVQEFEMSNVKLVGAIGWAWIASALAIAFAWPHIEPLLLRNRSSVGYPARAVSK